MLLNDNPGFHEPVDVSKDGECISTKLLSDARSYVRASAECISFYHRYQLTIKFDTVLH